MKPVDLIEHPEGGRYLEVFRSKAVVTRADGQERSALTHIYFSLDQGEVSRFHLVQSDEIWNLYRGAGLRLYIWDGTESPPQQIELSPQSESFCHVVPAGCWQAAEPLAETVLVGCSVGPGFEFDDFQMMDQRPDLVDLVKDNYPELLRFTLP